MKLDKTARAILGITALAWSVPFAQAAETRQPGVPAAQQNSARFVQLDADRNGAEQKHKALLVASGVSGVKDVKDGLAVRK